MRKEIKRDGHMNAIFEEIHANFFLLNITNDLFIENAAGFNPTIQHLASNAFTRLNIGPKHIPNTFMATVSICHINMHMLHSFVS